MSVEIEKNIRVRKVRKRQFITVFNGGAGFMKNDGFLSLERRKGVKLLMIMG